MLGPSGGRRDHLPALTSDGHTSAVDRPAPLTVQELARELDCSEEDIRTLIRAGELRTVACGVRPGLVPRHVLEEYRRRLKHRA